MNRQIVSVAVAALLLAAPAIQSQMPLPPIVPYRDSAEAMGHITAAELAWRTWVNGIEVESVVGFRDTRYPIDSLLKLSAVTATDWFGELQRHPIKGIQLDPSAEVAVMADNETNARAQVRARLATPGISFDDRAYTLLTAVRDFTNYHFPDRLPVAEEYLKQLAALGGKADPWQFDAHAAMMNVYYELGRTADVIRHGKRALELTATMPDYVERYYHGQAAAIAGVYLETAEALAGQADGRQVLDSLNAKLRAGTVAPAELIALDTLYVKLTAEWNRKGVDFVIHGADMLGTVGKDVTENYWVNRPTHDSATLPIGQGHVTLLETFPYTCDGCVMEMFSLQRVQAQFPDIRIIGTTYTIGGWANRILDGPEEAEHLRAYFQDQLKLTLPIGIWMGQKTVHADGSLTPFGPDGEIPGPTASFYPSMSKSTVWVMDANGRIRRIYTGFDRDMEAEIARTVKFLEHESGNQVSTPPSAPGDAHAG